MKLVIISELNKGKVFEIQDGNNLIGRWDPEDKSFPEIDLEQEDEEAKISRRHCVVIKDKDQIFVEDIGSLNGTYVNKTHKLSKDEKYLMKKGDQLLVGRTLFELQD